jgi:hypothetical protein
MLQQQMRIETTLKNAKGHDGRRGENNIIEGLIRIVKDFLAAEAVVQTEQPHAKGKREALIKEVQDQH